MKLAFLLVGGADRPTKTTCSGTTPFDCTSRLGASPGRDYVLTRLHDIGEIKVMGISYSI
jgi:hypothetical protein